MPYQEWPCGAYGKKGMGESFVTREKTLRRCGRLWRTTSSPPWEACSVTTRTRLSQLTKFTSWNIGGSTKIKWQGFVSDTRSLNLPAQIFGRLHPLRFSRSTLTGIPRKTRGTLAMTNYAGTTRGGSSLSFWVPSARTTIILLSLSVWFKAWSAWFMAVASLLSLKETLTSWSMWWIT